MPWGFGKKSPPASTDPEPGRREVELEAGPSATQSPQGASPPLAPDVRFRIEAVVRFGGLYSVIGTTEQGTLRLPTVLKRLRVTPTSESGVPIPVVSAMAHRKKLIEVPTGMKVSLTFVYEYDKGNGLFPNAAPNLFGLEKGDLLVTA
jgi:hypothetical protein